MDLGAGFGMTIAVALLALWVSTRKVPDTWEDDDG